MLDRGVVLEAGIPVIESASLRATVNGGAVKWESCALPHAFEAVNGVLYIVASAEFTQCAPVLKTYRTGGWAAWKLVGQDWVRIGYEEVPKTIRANLAYDYSVASVAKYIHADEKKGELHVRNIGWCEEGWREDGDARKCRN